MGEIGLNVEAYELVDLMMANKMAEMQWNVLRLV